MQGGLQTALALAADDLTGPLVWEVSAIRIDVAPRLWQDQVGESQQQPYRVLKWPPKAIAEGHLEVILRKNGILYLRMKHMH